MLVRPNESKMALIDAQRRHRGRRRAAANRLSLEGWNAARMTPRRFPPPWTIGEHEEYFILRDAAGGLAYIGC